MNTLTIDGKKLKEFRHAEKMTQQQLADKVFFSRRRIIALEQGCVTPINTLKALAHVLDIDYNSLIK